MTVSQYWWVTVLLSFIMFLPVRYLGTRKPLPLGNVIVCAILATAFGPLLWPFQLWYWIQEARGR